MHSKSDNIKFTSYNYADGVVNELFELFRPRFHENLETSTRGSGYIFDLIQLMDYKCTCWFIY